jgi:hypothetical protein
MIEIDRHPGTDPPILAQKSASWLSSAGLKVVWCQIAIAESPASKEKEHFNALTVTCSLQGL